MGRESLILLDTHVWVWWATDRSRLTRTALNSLKADSDRIVSVVSCWEIASLVRRERLKLDRPPELWIEDSVTCGAVEIMALTADIAVAAGMLPDDVVRDPADRILVATALGHRISLVTRDTHIRNSGLVTTIW